MPIKDKSKYPANWAEISKQQIKRANNKCELCFAPNGRVLERPLKHHQEELDRPWYYCGEVDNATWDTKETKIVLTTHHIQWLEDQKKNNSYPNLIALCPRCHLRLDLGKHMDNNKKSRLEKKYKNNLKLIT